MIGRIGKACKSLLLDEGGQTMLEYIVIVVFVVIAAIVAFRIISGIVQRGARRVSTSVGL